MSKSTLEYLTNLTGLESVTIPELVTARVKKSPNHTFVNFEGESWTYYEAWQAL